MAYTVISVFPETANAEEIKKDLTNQGFNEADIIVSKSKLENESSDSLYEEDEKTKSFWDYMFANENELLSAYSEHSVGKSNIIVYAQTIEDAQKAKSILNQNGAINVKRKDSDNLSTERGSNTAGLPEDVYNGIIAKARHNLYFLDSERTYRSNTKGMEDTMDDLGSKD